MIGIPSITAQLYGENIGDWIDEQARAQNFGWEITISGIDAGDGPAYNIDFLTGNDLTVSVIFSPEYGNLLSVDFTESTVNYKNVALVGGEGEGTSQIKTAVSIGNKVGMGRHEIYVNGVSRSTNGGSIPLATYRKMLQQYGVTELIKSTKTMTARLMSMEFLRLELTITSVTKLRLRWMQALRARRCSRTYFTHTTATAP